MVIFKCYFSGEHIARIIAVLIGENFVSQKQKADGSLRLYRDVNTLKFQKRERGRRRRLIVG